MTIEDAVLIDYAVGTLPREQVEEVERFLRSHPEAAAEVRRMQDTVAQLVLSLPPETTSQASEAALVERLSRHEEPPRKRRVRTAREARRSPRWAALGLAAALGIAAWLVLSPFSSSDRVGQLIARYEGQPGALSSRLTTEDGADLGTLVRLQDNRMFVAFERKPANGVYQLWEIRGEDIVSLGVVDDLTALTPPVAGGSTFGVTIEPAGGSAQPTAEPLVLVPL